MTITTELYARLVYPRDKPGVGVVVGGTIVVPKVPVVDVSGLVFVDKVFAFRMGSKRFLVQISTVNRRRV